MGDAGLDLEWDRATGRRTTAASGHYERAAASRYPVIAISGFNVQAMKDR